MNSTDILQVFGSEMGALGLQIVREDERLRYLDDAYRRFVRLTGGIVDSTSEATEVDIISGESPVDLHPSILQVRHVTRESDGGVIEVINQADVPRLGLRRSDIGEVKYLVLGTQIHQGTWFAVPQRDDIAHLMVYRLPLKHITSVGQALNEVDEDHHYALLDWMKSLAFKRPGAEFFNPKLSAEFAGSFVTYCSMAKVELSLTKNKVRSVTYGGL